MTWETIASGTSDNVPEVPIESNTSYRLTLSLPTPAPQWVADLIYNALRLLGVWVEAVAVYDNAVEVVFSTGDMPGVPSGGGGGLKMY